MFEIRNTVTIPAQEHRQVSVNVILSKIIRQFLEIQYRLRNLQAIVADSTVRILSKTEFLCEERNAIFKFRYGLNGLVQVVLDIEIPGAGD